MKICLFKAKLNYNLVNYRVKKLLENCEEKDK